MTAAAPPPPVQNIVSKCCLFFFFFFFNPVLLVLVGKRNKTEMKIRSCLLHGFIKENILKKEAHKLRSVEERDKSANC